MPTLRTRIGLVVLILVAGVLGYRVWSRGFGLRLGAAPSVLTGPHRTEAQWAVASVAGDIAEMLQYAADPAGFRADDVAVTVTPAGTGFQAQVTLHSRRIDVPIDAREGVWSPATYTPLAASLMRELRLAPLPRSTPDTADAFTARLLVADAAGLERESERLGSLLATRLLDADLHDDAALLLVAFSLREAADRLSDDRPQLLRMLAHLSLATALRGTGSPRFAGTAASAYVDHLAGRSRDASRSLAALAAAGGAEPHAAWVRVLSTRVDEDWRRLPTPSTLVERREAFRARVRSVQSRYLPSESAEAEPRPEADWGRIVRADLMRVNNGDLIEGGLERERAEIASVWSVTHGGGALHDPIAALDGERIGAMTTRGPRPLSWGLWSRFFERHLVSFAARIDMFYRHSIAANDRAERIGDELDSQLAELDLYPAATAFRTRGAGNGDADLRQIDKAIRVTLRRPEIVPAVVWAWLEYGQQYEPIAKGMPTAASWFATPAPGVAAFDLDRRLDAIGLGLDQATLEALWRDAPASYRVAEVNLDRRYAKKATAEQVQMLFGPRMEYDLRARRRLIEVIPAAPTRVPIEEGSCAIDVQSCVAFARALVDAGRHAEGAAVYEKTFADARIGSLVVAHNAAWLIEYLRRTGHEDRALALAARVAETGASVGVYAQAELFESLDRLDEAEEGYTFLADRYDESYQPLAFYYRMARVRKLPAYEPRLQAALAAVFPGGLQPLGPADAKQAPTAAVQITKDSALSRKHGMQAGDLIVGVDGWKVENVSQYQAVRRFSTDDRIQLVLWRGARIDVDAKVEDRAFNVDLRSYPIKGWRE